ncbi:UNVERIFIED_ORG: hypothetical protein QFZ59_001266 [Bacillus sp. B2I3]|nr:hypothetical protein [Bacillus sp. B2I3]
MDFHSRHSLSAGGPPSTLRACGVSLGHAFPQESRTFRSNQLDFFFGKYCRKTGASLHSSTVWRFHQFFGKRSIGLLTPNQDFISKLDYLSYFLLVYKLIFHY